MLLLTASKDKIGDNLAYPVGAELVSRAVGDIPQAAQTSISFRAKTTIRASQFNDILHNGTDYTIIECSLDWDGPNYWGISDNISWRIVVYPVLREWKTIARDALWVDGLPNLRNFLLQTNTSVGRQSYFSITFSPSEKRVYC